MLSDGIQFILDTAFIWAPIVLIIIVWKVWLWYVNETYLRSQKWTILEVRIPKDVFKSPAAMELMFTNALYQTGGFGDWASKYFNGKYPAYHSLEMVSIGGAIYFFIRIQSKFKAMVESQIYAGYPQAEVNEVPDYMNDIPPYTSGEIELWGMEFCFEKNNAYPIKTYVDYGLDQTLVKEEQKIDPITQTIEYMANLGKDEYMMMQICIRPSNWELFEIEEEVEDKETKEKKKIKKVVKWSDAAKNEINKYRKAFAKEGALPMSKVEGDVLNSMQRALQKFSFDTGIRAIYLAKKGSFDANKIAVVGSLLRQYNTMELNGFKGTNTIGYTHGFEDLDGKKTAEQKDFLLEDYRDRHFFHSRFPFSFKAKHLKYWLGYHPGHFIPPSDKKLMVMNTEELATIFHFPGRVSETPSFKRLESKKSEAPTNLPI